MAAQTTTASESWTQRLREHCQARGLTEPTYQDVSDRRGGRTAWSTVTTINGVHYPARFWYDGDYVAQAKEDSAEIALRTLTGTLQSPNPPPPASYYART
ncbi:hypothetical protein EK21DRAFT_107363 [Setomelanomma holmii]|uniref:DRBM domain-containing protein n=1 Tax=Setomelanomma holmii TaxID=210430 RepID=A0A9P4HJ82_9PLEO|nr:hypothetical protein EK21DRAFT_107363 [Setomelanomma holmii]